MHPATRLLLIALALALNGSSGCPFLPSDSDAGAAGDAGATMDIGGPNGAYWTLTFGSQVTVTLRASGKVATKQADSGAAPFALLASTIHLGSFCSRSDTLCPASVLPASTLIVQPSGNPAMPVIGFNRAGPLLVAKNQVGLYGVLSGSQLRVPLGTSDLPAAKGDRCALYVPSAIAATASASSGGNTADTLAGTVTLAYIADCFNTGGSGTVQYGATVELSASFTGKRKTGS